MNLHFAAESHTIYAVFSAAASEGSPGPWPFSRGERASGDGAFSSRRRTGEGLFLRDAGRANSNGKWQTAKFKWFIICHLFRLKNDLPFDLCHLPFELFVVLPHANAP
jgi:hypothetical protein